MTQTHNTGVISPDLDNPGIESQSDTLEASTIDS